MTNVPSLDLKALYKSIRGEVLPALESARKSTGIAQGPPTVALKQEFAGYCGVNYYVSLNGGTSAPHLAMRRGKNV